MNKAIAAGVIAAFAVTTSIIIGSSYYFINRTAINAERHVVANHLCTTVDGGAYAEYYWPHSSYVCYSAGGVEGKRRTTSNIDYHVKQLGLNK